MLAAEDGGEAGEIRGEVTRVSGEAGHRTLRGETGELELPESLRLWLTRDELTYSEVGEVDHHDHECAEKGNEGQGSEECVGESLVGTCEGEKNRVRAG